MQQEILALREIYREINHRESLFIHNPSVRWHDILNDKAGIKGLYQQAYKLKRQLTQERSR